MPQRVQLGGPVRSSRHPNYRGETAPVGLAPAPPGALR